MTGNDYHQKNFRKERENVWAKMLSLRICCLPVGKTILTVVVTFEASAFIVDLLSQ